jgi:hypothetical protein
MKYVVIEKCREDSDQESGARFKSIKEARKVLSCLCEPEHWKIIKEQSK